MANWGLINAFLVKSKYDETRNGENILSNNSDPNIKANDFGWWIVVVLKFPWLRKTKPGHQI